MNGRRTAWLSLRLILSVAIFSFPAVVHTDDPVSSSIRFNREIIRIIQRKCEPCHAAGSLVMSLSTYRAARDWGRAIREELVEQRMPPSSAAPGYRAFEADPSLTAREMMTMLTWLDGGMPRGDERDLPPRAEPASNGLHADLRLAVPPQTVPAGDDLIVRRVRVDAGGAAGRRAARVQFQPGDRRVVRGAVVYAANGAGSGSESSRDGSSWLDAWLPWQPTMVPPPGHAFTIPAGAVLVVELYYRGGDETIVDRSAIAVTFAGSERADVHDIAIETSPGPSRATSHAHALRGQRVLSEPATLWAMQADVDASITSLELRAERPDGTIEVLLWMPSVRHDWPHAFVLRDPLTLPAGSTIALHATAASPSDRARVRVSAVP